MIEQFKTKFTQLLEALIIEQFSLECRIVIGLSLVHYTIGLKKSDHFFIQSEVCIKNHNEWCLPRTRFVEIWVGYRCLLRVLIRSAVVIFHPQSLWLLATVISFVLVLRLSMANYLCQTRLQGIMVAVFIKINIQSKSDKYNYHDSLQAHLIEWTGHWKPLNIKISQSEESP